MAYDQITQYLCQKAAEDVRATVERTGAFLDDPVDQMMVAIFASTGCLGAAAGYCAALVEQDTGEKPEPEAVVDAVWDMIRPGLLSASGGSRAPFNALLARVSAGAKP